jgi:hypothetical protein
MKKVVTPKPGDLIFCHSTGIMGRIIRLGERIRFRKGVQWNHVALVDRMMEDGDFLVIQAEAKGVTKDKRLSTIAPGGRYQVVRLPVGVSRQKVLDFAHEQVGSRYGWLTILSIAIDILTPFWVPSFRTRNSWICSAVSAEALRAGGWIHQWPDVYLVTPTMLWDAVSDR